jgi:parvulin-like peptidyl-prolyl isomerase
MEHESNKKIKLGTILQTVVMLVILYIILIGILIYGLNMDNAVIRASAKVIPYPAAVISSKHVVLISELQKNLKSVQNFYENQNFSEAGLRVDFSTENGRKRLLVKKKEILNKLIENKIVEMLARERGIAISNDAVTQAVGEEIEKYGNKDETLENLQKLYGWSQGDFEKNLVKPDLYQAALEKYVRENEIDFQKAKEKIGQALDEIKNNRRDFSEVAKEYSEGESAKNGGDLGWFSAEQMLPQLSVVAFTLAKGEMSDTIESALGYHVIILDDKKTGDGVEKIKIRQIFVKTENFGEWLAKQEKNIKIFIPLKDFSWNTEIGEVELKEKDMQFFEQNLDKNSVGDASVMF